MPSTVGAEAGQAVPRVLIVEDDPNDRQWIARTLGTAGYEVEAVATGAEANERCAKHRYDAITLDLLLPDMHGREILRSIRASGPNTETPVVIVTVVADSGAGIGFHVYDVLVKPVTGEGLLTALGRARVEAEERRPILVVDDDPRDAKLAKRILEDAGYRVVSCADGEQALETATATNPALILLDLVMPRLDGIAFLERFRATTDGRNVPVIVWTAHDLSAADRDKIRSSAQALVMKSATAASLIAELGTLVPIRTAPAAAPQAISSSASELPAS